MIDMGDIMRAVIYARVSTDIQSLEYQLFDLRQISKNLGYKIVDEITDFAISGAKGRDERPGFDRLFNLVETKSVDIILAWSVDRIGRSMIELSQFVQHLHKNNVELYCHKQQVNTSTPAGRMIFNMLSATAEYEREMIIERINSGIARAKHEGVKFGRPRTHDDDKIEKIVEMKSQGATYEQISKELEVGYGTVWRAVENSKKAFNNT